MDKLFLKNLEFDVLIGVYEAERQQKQRIILDLELAIDTQQAAASDQLKNTLDYDLVIRSLTELMASSQYYLIEALSHQIADLLLNNFKLPWVRIRLKKPEALAGSAGVELLIERGSIPTNN